MSTASFTSSIQREPELLGQTVVVIGGSAGIGLETPRRARAEGAKVILTARDHERLKHAATEIDALSTSAFDAADPIAIEQFFHALPTIDHVMVTAVRRTTDVLPIWTSQRYVISSANTFCRRSMSLVMRPAK